MSKSIARRQILRMARGFVAGAAAARSIPLLVNVIINPATAVVAHATQGAGSRDEFIGPFPNWSNVNYKLKASGENL